MFSGQPLILLVFSSLCPLSTHLYIFFLFSSGAGSFVVPPPVRHYARAAKKKKTGIWRGCTVTKPCFHVFQIPIFHPNVSCLPVPQSQLDDLPPTMLKMDYSAVPLAQTYIYTLPHIKISKNKVYIYHSWWVLFIYSLD